MKKLNNYKSPASSLTIKTEVVCPNDTNPMGFLQGVHLVEWMDIAAAVCAQTHAEKICVTASIKHVDFNEDEAKVLLHKINVEIASLHISRCLLPKFANFKIWLKTVLLISEKAGIDNREFLTHYNDDL